MKLKELLERNQLIVTLKEKCDSIAKLATSSEQLKNALKDKTSQITSLEIRLEELEKSQSKHNKQQEKKIKNVENHVKQTRVKGKNSENDVPIDDIFSCERCDFTTTSRQGLKIHNAKTHSKIDFEAFPAACDICEKVLENEKCLNQHKKREHTFHIVKFQCNECEFMANDPHTFHVHFGMYHANKKACGLCDKTFKNIEELKEHLRKCEIFVCDNSGCREIFHSASTVRDHIKENHRKGSPEHYSFSYYICHSKDQSEKEVKKSNIRIYPEDW